MVTTNLRSWQHIIQLRKCWFPLKSQHRASIGPPLRIAKNSTSKQCIHIWRIAGDIMVRRLMCGVPNPKENSTHKECNSCSQFPISSLYGSQVGGPKHFNYLPKVHYHFFYSKTIVERLSHRGVLPYISHIGMCRPNGTGVWAFLVWKRVYTWPILVWNRV